MNETLILPNRNEKLWGQRYLLFQLVFLGSFLSFAAGLLGITLSALTLNVLYFGVNFIVVALLCRNFLTESLGYGLHNLLRCLLVSVGGFAVYQLLMHLLALLIVSICPDFANVNDQNLSSLGQENYALMVICTVLLVPATEETLYRGILFGSVYRRSRAAAYLISTLVFCLVHITGYIGTAEPLTLLLCFLQYVPAGVCLAAAYEASGSILSPILIHTAVNAIGMMAMR